MFEPQDRAGRESPASGDAFRRDVEDARLRGQHEETVLRECPPGGTEPVAIKRRAKGDAIGERDGGGAVPRLHERGVVFAERAHVVAHVVFRAPCLRDEHHHRVRGVAPGCDEELEDVVERGGVALARAHDGKELREVRAEERRGERRLARGKRGEVALERVDLAIVCQGAERVCQLPARERVGRVALVDDGERGDEVRIRKVRVEPFDLRREKQALVDNGPRRAGADIGIRRGPLNLAADNEELPLEGGIADGCIAADEQLPDARHDLARVASDGRRIGRHVAPRENLAALAPDGSLDGGLFALSAEDHRDAEGLG